MENDIPKVKKVIKDAVIVNPNKSIQVIGDARTLIVRCPLCNQNILEPYTHLNYYPCCGGMTTEYKNSLQRILNAHTLHNSLEEAKRLFEKSEYSSSSRSAVIAIEDYVKCRINRPDLFGVALINEAFDSVNDADPKIKINNYSNRTEKNEHDGIKYLLIGFMKCIRNTVSHNLLSLDASNALSIILQCNLILNLLEYGSLKNERVEEFNIEEHADFLTKKLQEYGVPVFVLKNDGKED